MRASTTPSGEWAIKPRGCSSTSPPADPSGATAHRQAKASFEERLATHDEHHRQATFGYAERNDRIERPTIRVRVDARYLDLRLPASGESHEHRLKRTAPERFGPAVDPGCLDAEEPDQPTESHRGVHPRLQERRRNLDRGRQIRRGWPCHPRGRVSICPSRSNQNHRIEFPEPGVEVTPGLIGRFCCT